MWGGGVVTTCGDSSFVPAASILSLPSGMYSYQFQLMLPYAVMPKESWFMEIPLANGWLNQTLVYLGYAAARW